MFIQIKSYSNRFYSNKICHLSAEEPNGETASWGNYFNDFIVVLVLLIRHYINSVLYT